jgi:hypothetical protein
MTPQKLNLYSNPVDENFLQTEGPYGIVRHPIYSGLILLCFGLAMLTSSMERSILTIILFWVLDNKASNEEIILKKKLGKVKSCNINYTRHKNHRNDRCMMITSTTLPTSSSLSVAKIK